MFFPSRRYTWFSGCCRDWPETTATLPPARWFGRKLQNHVICELVESVSYNPPLR